MLTTSVGTRWVLSVTLVGLHLPGADANEAFYNMLHYPPSLPGAPENQHGAGSPVLGLLELANDRQLLARTATSVSSHFATYVRQRRTLVYVKRCCAEGDVPGTEVWDEDAKDCYSVLL